MAPRKEGEPDDVMRRLSNVIAVVAFKDQESEEAALRLETLGFTAKEIGGILGKNENYLHMIKNARKTKKKAREVMAINQELFGKLKTRLNLSRTRIYKLIQDIELTKHVSGHVASLMLAGQNGIPYSKYATAEDRAEIRAASGGAPVIQPAPAAPTVSTHTSTARPAKATRDNSIFVVHGRDEKLTQDMYSFLRAIGLNAMEWDDAIKAAKGGANPIVGDVITNAMKKVQGVMVLMSPDEDAKLKGKFANANDKKKGRNKLDAQPRPNVIFEAGLALGAHSDKTILVQVGDIREISDIAGKHMVHLSDSVKSRKNLALRLQDKLKFKVNLTGNDWIDVGKFNR